MEVHILWHTVSRRSTPTVPSQVPESHFKGSVEQGNTVQKPELVRAVSRATGIVEGALDQSIKELRDQFGQTTVLRFSSLERNPRLNPDLFKFTPPKDADVLGD